MYQLTDKVVVTGGAGFIGSHLVERLLSNEARGEIVVFDNLRRGRLANLVNCRQDARLRLIHADLRDAGAVREAIAGASVVYHLGAQSSVLGAVEDLEYTFATNVVGTFNVLRSAALQGVQRVVFASSREVYGEPIDLPVDEDAPLLAISSYGASKAAGEAFCRSFRREFALQTVILRLANVYGPRDVDRVIPLWVKHATAGQDLHVYGGKQVVDFVWIEQTVDALVMAAGVEGPLPPINVGSGTGTRILDLARRIARLAAGPARVRLLPARPVDVTRFVANVERMRLLLRVEPPLDPLGYLSTLTGSAVAIAR